MVDNPDGVYLRIPLDDASLAEARELVEDASFYEDTRIPILFHFPQVTVDGYWDLTVGDHRKLVEYLNAKGLG